MRCRWRTGSISFRTAAAVFGDAVLLFRTLCLARVAGTNELSEHFAPLKHWPGQCHRSRRPRRHNLRTDIPTNAQADFRCLYGYRQRSVRHTGSPAATQRPADRTLGSRVLSWPRLHGTRRRQGMLESSAPTKSNGHTSFLDDRAVRLSPTRNTKTSINTDAPCTALQ